MTSKYLLSWVIYMLKRVMQKNKKQKTKNKKTPKPTIYPIKNIIRTENQWITTMEILE